MMISRGFMTELDKRKRQVDTLKIFNDNVVEIVENEEYRVEFKAGSRNMSISVRLGAAFPAEKPGLFVSPLVIHPWLHQLTGEVVDAPGLLNFTVHSDLGRVVQAIIRDFERNPPVTVTEAADQPKANAAPRILDSLVDNSLEGVVMSALQRLTTEQLQDLQDPDILEEYLDTFPMVQASLAELQGLMQDVENLAVDVLAKQEALDQFKAHLQEKVETIGKLKESYEELSKTHQTIADQYAPQNIRELLRQAASESDEACEAIAERFLSGQCRVETFIQQYTTARKLSHTRKAKEERLGSQLNALHRAGF